MLGRAFLIFRNSAPLYTNVTSCSSLPQIARGRWLTHSGPSSPRTFIFRHSVSTFRTSTSERTGVTRLPSSGSVSTFRTSTSERTGVTRLPSSGSVSTLRTSTSEGTGVTRLLSSGSIPTFRTSIPEGTGVTRLLSSVSGTSGDTKVVYVAPLKGAVRAIKVFSLGTAVASFFGGPVLVWLGNPSVPLAGRLIMASLVMLVGLGTTGLLHWIVKGYVMKMEYNDHSGDMTVYTLSLFAKLKKHHFNVSESGPPSKATAFSSFQAKGKSFFMHSEVFEDRELLSKILGAYVVFEDPNTWK